MHAVCSVLSYLIILWTMVRLGHSFSRYQSEIPNGHRVPDPCAGHSSTWSGVGHRTSEGGAARNAFGKDFYSHGKVWNKSLCNRDSDGDGLTNGQELGDPDCTWTKGRSPQKPASSHPGICEPLDSPRCEESNSWLTCRDGHTPDEDVSSICPHLDRNSTISKDVRLHPMPVPPKETTYMCQIIDLDLEQDADLHMVATQPIIQARSIVHHILLFGCEDSVHAQSHHERLSREPWECFMSPPYACQSLIGYWTRGTKGECANPEMGFRIGSKGYKTLALQVHWNNPELLSNFNDSSGLRIHLTKKLRKHDAGVLIVGPRFLQIDPQGRDSSPAHFSSTCTSSCTKTMLTKPIYITTALNHMHYLGKHQSMTLYRNNTEIRNITSQDDYNYDDPIIYGFKEPIEFHPGDEIKTVCTFKRPSPSHPPVCWGDATADEMCFGFLTFYPRQAFIPETLEEPGCFSVRDMTRCDLLGKEKREFDGCRWTTFGNYWVDAETNEIFDNLTQHCVEQNLTVGASVCSEACTEVAQRVAKHPCISGKAGSFMLERMMIRRNYGWRELLSYVEICTNKKFDYCDKRPMIPYIERLKQYAVEPVTYSITIDNPSDTASSQEALRFLSIISLSLSLRVTIFTGSM